MPQKSRVKTNGAQHKHTNGNGSKAATEFAPPPVASGFSRKDIEPIFWTYEGELHGAMVDVETTSRAGKTINAIVIVATAPALGVNDYGELVEVAVNDPIRVDEPKLLRYAPFAMDPGVVPRVILRSAIVNGIRRVFFDMSDDPAPRDDFKPKTMLSPAQPAAAASS